MVPATAGVCGWYALFVLLASYARDFMSIKVIGMFNIGLVLGLLQFVSTSVVTFWYLRYTTQRIDPLAAQLRAAGEAR